MKIEGTYQGKNLYVQNPFAPTGSGFCTISVAVNGRITTDDISSSAYEIDLRMHNLKIGDTVVVEIQTREGCNVKVLNPEVLKPRSTFTATSIAVNPSATPTLEWETTGELGSLDYIVQQFKWNKWVDHPTPVTGKGTAGSNKYTTPAWLHTGENTFRVVQRDYTGQPRTSPSCKFKHTAAAITFSPVRVENQITFSAATQYEILDSHGNKKKQGYGTTIDLQGLPKGGYFLNYDNTTGEFIKK